MFGKSFVTSGASKSKAKAKLEILKSEIKHGFYFSQREKSFIQM